MLRAAHTGDRGAMVYMAKAYELGNEKMWSVTCVMPVICNVTFCVTSDPINLVSLSNAAFDKVPVNKKSSFIPNPPQNNVYMEIV